MAVPAEPKIYHIIPVDRLTSVISDGFLWCDAEVALRRLPGTTIGMNCIKKRRLEELTLTSHEGLHVGDCVPFYFCPRSIMLFVIHQANHPGLDFRGGQGPIVHLEADLRQTVAWAQGHGRRWAFTLSNAGAFYFEDRCDLGQLGEIDWDAVQARDWRQSQEGKQAEFLIEKQFPWELVSRIGVLSQQVHIQVSGALQGASHKPQLKIMRDWYY
ncbi:MAG: DUF4433 domain-containing protein [Thermoanaerobaculales bacterium]